MVSYLQRNFDKTLFLVLGSHNCVLMLDIISAGHPDSTFDLALSGILEPNTSIHSTETLGEICRVLKPQGRLILGEAVTGDKSDESKVKSTEKLNSSLKLSGFVNIEQVKIFSKQKILVFGISDRVQPKSTCTVTEDG